MDMLRPRRGFLLPALLLTSLVLAACGSSGSGSGSSSESAANGKPSGSITVFAAASLTTAFEEIGANFMKAHPGTTVGFNFAGSNTLAQQITQGAPVDVFASADEQNMQDAAKDMNAPQTFVKNRLTVIVPKSNPGKIHSLKDLANKGVAIAVADPSVPIGMYTLQVLDKMGKSSAYGSGYESAVKANFVTLETSVTAIVQKVLLGEVDAGYVYVSDAVANQKDVTEIPIPKQYNVIAEYPIATAKTSGNPNTAQAFVKYLLTPAAQKILQENGFIPIS
jgi:molybdate transport system substrate-binding protein